MLYLVCATFSAFGGAIGFVVGARGKNLMAPDAFVSDPYGFVTNQAGHIVLGFGLVVLAVVLGFALAGEPPERWVLWLIVLSGFTSFELALGGEWWDALEDTVFTVGYGAGATLYAFTWYEGFTFLLDFLAVLPFVIGAAVHLAAGVAWRARRQQA
jgi:hypothetical protein